MIVGSIPRRYAKALFQLALEQNKLDRWSESLRALKKLVDSSPELRDVLENPVYTKEQRRAVAVKLISALRLDPEPGNLLYLLGDRNRLSALSGVVEAFSAMVDEKVGRLRARVVSAVPLDATVAQNLAGSLARATNCEVIMSRSVDPELVGGVIAQVGRLTYDGSIRTQLDELRRTLKQ